VRGVVVLVAVLSVVSSWACGGAKRSTGEAPRPAAVAAPPAPAAAKRHAPVEEDVLGEAPESNPTSETVTIKLVADPQRKARVFWGRKDLGLAPLELQRPRGSGPMDLLVVAPGALPLHTRVYTDRDDKLGLRLFAESEAPSMLGYHEPAETSATDAGKRKPGAVGGARKSAARQ